MLVYEDSTGKLTVFSSIEPRCDRTYWYHHSRGRDWAFLGPASMHFGPGPRPVGPRWYLVCPD